MTCNPLIYILATHADNDHAKEYQMAMLMIEAHAALWTPEATNEQGN